MRGSSSIIQLAAYPYFLICQEYQSGIPAALSVRESVYLRLDSHAPNLFEPASLLIFKMKAEGDAQNLNLFCKATMGQVSFENLSNFSRQLRQYFYSSIYMRIFYCQSQFWNCFTMLVSSSSIWNLIVLICFSMAVKCCSFSYCHFNNPSTPFTLVISRQIIATDSLSLASLPHIYSTPFQSSITFNSCPQCFYLYRYVPRHYSQNKGQVSHLVSVHICFIVFLGCQGQRRQRREINEFSNINLIQAKQLLKD